MRSYILAFLLFIFNTAQAAAVVVDFDSGAIVPGTNPQIYKQNGFTLTPNGFSTYIVGTDARDFAGWSGTGSSTNSLLFGAPVADPGTATLTRNDGNLFSLQGIDAAYTQGSSGILNIVGTLDGGGTVSHSLNLGNDIATFDLTGLGFNSLNQLEFSYDSVLYIPPIELDNIQLTAVPVPAAVWLFGSALAGLGWVRRKQSR